MCWCRNLLRFYSYVYSSIIKIGNGPGREDLSKHCTQRQKVIIPPPEAIGQRMGPCLPSAQCFTVSISNHIQFSHVLISTSWWCWDSGRTHDWRGWEILCPSGNPTEGLNTSFRPQIPPRVFLHGRMWCHSSWGSCRDMSPTWMAAGEADTMET